MLQYKKSCDHCGERITHCMLKQYTMVQGCCPTGTLGVGRCLLHSAVHSTLVASPLLRGRGPLVAKTTRLCLPYQSMLPGDWITVLEWLH